MQVRSKLLRLKEVRAARACEALKDAVFTKLKTRWLRFYEVCRRGIISKMVRSDLLVVWFAGVQLRGHVGRRARSLLPIVNGCQTKVAQLHLRSTDSVCSNAVIFSASRYSSLVCNSRVHQCSLR